MNVSDKNAQTETLTSARTPSRVGRLARYRGPTPLYWAIPLGIAVVIGIAGILGTGSSAIRSGKA